MKSAVPKHSIMLDGRKTSISLEEAFWTDLKEIAHLQGATVSSLITAINTTRTQSNLSSAIRVFVLEHVRKKDKGAGPRSTQPNEIQSTRYPRRG
jgi:predicted DNA-binding ribbon-helix-helix protein